MKFIIVIRCESRGIYERTVNDLKAQFAARLVEEKYQPLYVYFTNTVDEQASVEIVWIDPAMELEHLKLINSQVYPRDVTGSTNPATSEDYAALYDKLKATNI